MADRLRDTGEVGAAVEAYGTILAESPFLTSIRVQYGNMLKDCGRLLEAEAAYLHAAAESPDDADIHLQLGHVLKLMGHRPASLAAYQRAADLNPSLTEALRELSAAGQAGAQQRLFNRQVRDGGVEALLTLVGQVSDLRAKLDQMLTDFPDPRGIVAFPIERYTDFRRLFDVPFPPDIVPNTGITVLLTADPATPATLYAQLAALRAQSHPNWTAAVLGHDAGQRSVVERAAASDARIAWVEVAATEPLAAAELRAAQTALEWLLLAAPGAILHSHALAWIIAAYELGGAPAFFFDQEIGHNEGGHVVRTNPVLRQTVDYDTLLEANTCGHSVAVQRNIFLAQTKQLCFSSIASSRSSLLLELSHRSHVGHIPFPLAWHFAKTEPDESVSAHREAVAHHLVVAELKVEQVAQSEQDAPVTIRWLPHSSLEKFTVIVPTRNNPADLGIFIETLRMTAAQPDSLSVVVVDNGSDPSTRCLLDKMQQSDLHVLRMDEPFNWSRLNNCAVAHTQTSLLVFANDDMRMLTPGWDNILRGLLERPDVGAIGARLLYPDNSVQHAGVLLGWQGSAIHDGLYASADEPGPNDRWHLTRAVSAVTGAFLATRRQTFLDIGGFDADELPIAYSDIDYALKLRAAGLRVLWTPGITLHHYESKSRGLDYTSLEKQVRNASERRVMEQRWGAAMKIDPSVHPLWYDTSLPFRLITSASASRVANYIQTSAKSHPWRVTRERSV